LKVQETNAMDAPVAEDSAEENFSAPDMTTIQAQDDKAFMQAEWRWRHWG
jgi:hypothetical protein